MLSGDSCLTSIRHKVPTTILDVGLKMCNTQSCLFNFQLIKKNQVMEKKLKIVKNRCFQNNFSSV